MDINFESLLDPKTEIQATYRGKLFVHTLRNPTSKEWLVYNSRLSQFRRKGKKVVADDEAVGARLWLLGMLREKIEVLDAEKKRLELPKEYWPQISPDHEDAVIVAFLGQTEIQEEDEKNL